jgi:hypothetical protein
MLNIKYGKIKTDIRQTAKSKTLGFVPEYSGTRCLLPWKILLVQTMDN